MIDERLSRVFGEIAEQLPPSSLTLDALDARRTTAQLDDRRQLKRRRVIVSALVAAAGIVGVVGVAIALGDDHNVRTNEPANTSPSTSVPSVVVTTTDPVTTTTTATTTTIAPTRVTPSPTDVLAETIDRDALTVQLTLTDGVTGEVRDVLWGGSVTIDSFDDSVESPLLDADLGPDGTAYIVERTVSREVFGQRPGGTRLIATDTTPSRIIAENVTSVRVSPDSTRVAVSVLSPDGNGDGQGTMAVRVITLATGDTQTFATYPVLLDEAGNYASEFGNTTVESWLPDGSGIVYREACCDSGSVIVAPLDGSGNAETWPRVDGYYATYLVGFDPDGNPLIQRRPEDGGETLFEIVRLDLGSGAISQALATGEHELDFRERYDLVGSAEVPGAPNDRGVDAFAPLVGTTTSDGVVERVFG